MRHDWTTFRFEGHRLVVTAVRVADQIAKRADRFLRAYRLTLAQFNLLAVLYRHPSGVAQAQIGSELVVSRANVTVMLQRLKSRGLCAVARDPGDARVRRVKLAPAGAKLLDRIERPYLQEIERLTRHFPASELKRASDLLDRLQQALAGAGE